MSSSAVEGGGDGGGASLKRPAAAEPSRATPSPSHNASAPPVSKRRRTMRPCPDGEVSDFPDASLCRRGGRGVEPAESAAETVIVEMGRSRGGGGLGFDNILNAGKWDSRKS